MTDLFLQWEKIESRLEPDEKLLWSAQPNPCRLVVETIPQFVLGLFLIPAMVVFLLALGKSGFVVFSDVKPSSLFAGFLLAGFTIAVLYSVSLPFRAYRKSRRSIYGITDKRIIVCVKKIISFSFSDVKRIRLKKRWSGKDLIIIRRKRMAKPVILYGISDAERAEKIILEQIGNFSNTYPV